MSAKAVIGLVLVAVAIAAPYLAPELLGVAAGSFAAVAATVAVEAGVALAESALMGAAVPAGLQTDPRDRLYANLDTTAPRKIWFGHTAGGTDIRYDAYTGSDQEFYHQIICCASHQVHSIDELWIDNELAWTSAGGVQGRFVNFLTVDVRNPGTSANGIAIDSTWDATCTLTGCAYLHLRYKLTGPNKTTASPFQGGVSSRLTVRGKGALIYDPRLDDTVPGGSGPQRADDQITWVWDDDAARNGALEELWYELGWRINGKLAVGKGIPAERLDLESFITAANLCDEAVALKAGGTEPRYRCDGVVSEGDSPKAVRDTLCASMNATLRDSGGKIGLQVLHDDLSDPAPEFDENDILGDEEWVQGPPLAQRYNIVRGKFTDASDNALYQPSDYPEQSIPSPDGIDRILPLDFPMVQSGTQVQRLAKLKLMRNKYQGRYSSTLGPRAWQLSLGKLASMSHPGLSWTSKLFRTASQSLDRTGKVKLSKVEETSALYAWDPATDEKAVIDAGTPPVADPAKNPILPGTSDITVLIANSETSGLRFSIDTVGNITISQHDRIYSDSRVTVDGTPGTAADGTGGTPIAAPAGAIVGDVVVVFYEQQDRSGGAVVYENALVPGGDGDLDAYTATPDNPYRHFVCAAHVPASGSTSGGSGIGTGSGGTAGGGGGWTQLP